MLETNQTYLLPNCLNSYIVIEESKAKKNPVNSLTVSRLFLEKKNKQSVPVNRLCVSCVFEVSE